ncbi:MAG: VCBS repeat-containing protein [Planctomycetota bacterium]
MDSPDSASRFARLMTLIGCLTIAWSGVAVAQDATGSEKETDSNDSDASAWTRHEIDKGFDGADGVRLADFNGDGLADVVTGWEESGLVRLVLHPGPEHVRRRWPAVTVAEAKSPEDAMPCDMDGDGRMDIVSCHEGRQRQVLVHWNDSDNSSSDELLRAANWSSDRFTQLDGVQWMYAVPLGKIDGRTAIAVGAKGDDASLTLLVAPQSNPRDLSRWQSIRLRNVGWIMSMQSLDMDHDGDQDLVFSDRKGPDRCAGWLEQPDAPESQWPEHRIAGEGQEVMFLSATPSRWVIATRDGEVLRCQLRTDPTGQARRFWLTERLPLPRQMVMGKSASELPDGTLIVTANTLYERQGERPGIWQRTVNGRWAPLDPTTKVKFDRVELIDLDGDGDLDVMTCEEAQDLGVVWYENPRAGD